MSFACCLERGGDGAHTYAAALAGKRLQSLDIDSILPFDDEQLAGTTVADVLANPERYEGETLADPLEGIEYGR